MNLKTENKPNNPTTTSVPWTMMVRFFVLIAFMLVVLFLSAGSLDWWEGWAYTVMTLVTIIGGRTLMIRKNPDMAVERAEAGHRENVKGWDKILMPITAIYGPLVSWIIVGLDFRFGWSPDLPDSIQIAALVVIFLGNQLGNWAMIVNRFFSSHVRIQTDRGHQVISEGPYRFVRHPGYAGGVIAWIAGPVFFSSYWAVIPSLVVIILMVLRTSKEDRTLMAELPGYRAYAQRVPYRLIPGIW